MPEYIYKAVDANGVIAKNKVQEKSKLNLIKKLKANGLTPIDVMQTSLGKYTAKNKKNISNIDELMKIASEVSSSKQEKARSITTKERIRIALSLQEKVKERDIVIFTQNFYLLKKAGFNNVHALETLVKSTENSSLRGILEDVLAGVQAGEYMYTTLEFYSDIFPYIYINLIKVGELSGSLEESLRQAIEFLDSSTALTKKIKKILIPNITQFVLLIIILFAGSLYLIPTIQDVFAKVGSTDSLPSYTIAFSNFLTQFQRYWFIPVILLAAVAGWIYMQIQTPRGKYKWDYFKYKMPVFGSLIFAIDFERLTNAMLLNLKNGMRIQEALEVSKNVTKNLVMLSIIETSINNIIVGESWIQPFEDSGLAGSMVTEMLKIGMQTDLTAMMEKLVEYMDLDINQLLDRIVKILPQILYSVMGVLLIFITIVVLVPCIQVYMGGWMFSAAGF